MSTPESVESTAAKVEEEVAARIAAHVALYGAEPDESTVDVFRRSARNAHLFPSAPEEGKPPPTSTRMLFVELMGMYLIRGSEVSLARDSKTGRMTFRVGERVFTDDKTPRNLRELQEAIAAMSKALPVGSTVHWIVRHEINGKVFGASIVSGKVRAVRPVGLGNELIVEVAEGAEEVVSAALTYGSKEAAKGDLAREVTAIQQHLCDHVNHCKRALADAEDILEASRAAFGDPTAPEELRKPEP